MFFVEQLDAILQHTIIINLNNGSLSSPPSCPDATAAVSPN